MSSSPAVDETATEKTRRVIMFISYFCTHWVSKHYANWNDLICSPINIPRAFLHYYFLLACSFSSPTLKLLAACFSCCGCVNREEIAAAAGVLHVALDVCPGMHVPFVPSSFLGFMSLSAHPKQSTPSTHTDSSQGLTPTMDSGRTHCRLHS